MKDTSQGYEDIERTSLECYSACYFLLDISSFYIFSSSLVILGRERMDLMMMTIIVVVAVMVCSFVLILLYSFQGRMTSNMTIRTKEMTEKVI
jgi:hypothetical protein